MEGKGVNPQGVTVKEKQDRDSDQEFKLFCSILNRIKYKKILLCLIINEEESKHSRRCVWEQQE